MKNFSMIMLSLSLVSSVISMETGENKTAESALSLRLQQLSLEVKKAIHQSMVYRTLRFADSLDHNRVNKEIIARDEEIVRLEKKFPKTMRERHNNPKRYYNPVGDEQTIIEELREQYYLPPQKFELRVSYDHHLPKEWFPLEMAFISHEKASRAVLIPMGIAYLPTEERIPGHKSLRLPHPWHCPKDTYVKHTDKGWQEVKRGDLFQKNNSFFMVDGDYAEQEYREKDWHTLFQDGQKLQSLEWQGSFKGCEIHDWSNIFKSPFALYLGADEKLSFSYSIIFKTQTGLVYQEDFARTWADYYNFSLEKDKFFHPKDLYSVDIQLN